MAESNLGSINLRPNKPDAFDGRRDYLTVNTWLFKVQQYLQLSALSGANAEITDESRIMFASSYLTSTAASWWYTVIQAGRTPTTWEEFRSMILSEFVPEDHVRRARDRLRRLKQTSSVSKYIAEFRNCVLMINDVSAGERFDRFVQGLKKEVRLEVLKSQASEFEEATRIALRVDSALWSQNDFRTSFGSTGKANDPMEIGNLQHTNQSSDAQRRRRAHDLKNNLCVACHKKGCRPWKCQPKRVNNVEAIHDRDDVIDSMTFDDAVDSESEN